MNKQENSFILYCKKNKIFIREVITHNGGLLDGVINTDTTSIEEFAVRFKSIEDARDVLSTLDIPNCVFKIYEIVKTISEVK